MVVCLQGHMGKAQDVFKSMVDMGLEPDIWSYTILINGYINKMNTETIPGNSFKGLEATVVTYTTILKWLLQIGKFDAVENIFLEMLFKGQHPSIFTYSVLLASLRTRKLARQ